MGYTHYWDEPGKSTNQEVWGNFLNDCKEIVDHGAAILANWDGVNYPDLSNVEKTGINFNGRGDYSHENCLFPSYMELSGGFQFCKTAQKPYDLYVTACLVVFHSYFGRVTSDGEAYEWADGLALAKQVLDRNFDNPIQEEE